MANKQILDPGWAWDDDFPISQAVQRGNMIFISGQVAIDPSGQIVGKGDMKAQTRQALENIKTLLALAGCNLNDIMTMTTFITDMSKVDDALEVRTEYLGQNPPASATVEVKSLIFSDLMIEIQVIAMQG